MESEKEREQREKLDLLTIEALRDKGSDLSKPHYLEHHFVVTKEYNITKITDTFKREGYEISQVLDTLDEDGEKYYFFDVCKYCLVQPNTIFEESKKMTEIALSFNEFYDGWGTNIVE